MDDQLQARLRELATKFADEVLALLRGMSLSEILEGGGAARPAPAARAKRSSAAPRGGALSVEAIVAALRSHPNGLRAELLRREVGAKKSLFNYYARKAVSEGKVRKTGKKRSTTYFAK